MKIKIALFLIGSLTAFTSSLDIETIRQNYVEASTSEEATIKLHDDLTSVAINDGATFVAFKGAVTTMMAAYGQGIKEKKTYFKDGKELLEFAIAAEPNNIEIRCIRLSVQENAPRIVGYHKNVEEDKNIILEKYESISDAGSKKFVKEYALQSEAFSLAEKELF